jgi:hypothetical protein
MKVVSLLSRQTAGLSENHSTAAWWPRENGKPLGGDLVIADRQSTIWKRFNFPGGIRGLSLKNNFDRLIARFVSSGKKRESEGSTLSLLPVEPSASVSGSLSGVYSLRRATWLMMWLAPLLRIRSERWRVGRMFSCRLTRLMLVQIALAVLMASSSVKLA